MMNSLLFTYKRIDHRFKKRYLWATFFCVWLFRFRRRKKSVTREVKPNTLLLVRFDLIGDYILFRNFLTDIRHSRFKNYHITLCGNVAFKNLAENLDCNVVDEFIWVERRRFLKEKAYHFSVMQQLNDGGFEIAFQPTFSREKFGDLLVYASAAKERIGVDGDAANQSLATKKITDSFYTELIAVDAGPKFEFFRNKEIVEKFIADKSTTTQPGFDVPSNTGADIPPAEYAVLVLGASHPLKQWPFFHNIVDYLVERLHLKIVLVGQGKRDRAAIAEFIKQSGFRDVVNLCDSTTLLQLADVLRRAKLVVSNDTAAMHIAAVQETPTVCITLGTHAFRFNNYPTKLGAKVQFVFPPHVESLLQNGGFQHYQTHYKGDQSINSITPERIIQSIKEVLAVAS